MGGIAGLGGGGPPFAFQRGLYMCCAFLLKLISEKTYCNLCVWSAAELQMELELGVVSCARVVEPTLRKISGSSPVKPADFLYVIVDRD